MCNLQKSIYGLKHASRSWNIKFDQSVNSFGFIQCPNEPCEGIGAAEECVEGNKLVKGATKGFQKFSYKQYYGDN